MKELAVRKKEQGFTLIEIIAVLVILGILAAVAVPKYMDMSNQARKQAAVGQIAEVKGRLSQALANFMLSNGGEKPTTGVILVTKADEYKSDSCPTTATTEGDFEFKCTGKSTQDVTITVSAVQGVTLPEEVNATYSFAD